MNLRALTIAGMALVLAGCGTESAPGGSQGGSGGAAGGTDIEKQAATSVTDWLKAAVNRDGKAYCAQLTFDLLERLTGEQSDQATKECEKSAASPLAGDLPLRIGVVPENATAQKASVKLIAEIPEEAALVTEGGKLKIDDVDGGTGKGEDPGGREGGSPEEKDAEKAVQDWLVAAIDEDGATYCQQLTVKALERVTGERGDQAKKKCERLVKAEESPSKLPLDVDVVAKSSKEKSASAEIRRELPKEIVLIKEEGKYKIDRVD